MKSIVKPKRTAHVLSVDPASDRTQFSKNVLENIGFDVKIFESIPHKNKILSNRQSFQSIYEIIIQSGEEYSYVFEDDINILAPITLDEIIQYEAISEHLFFLGICEYGNKNVEITNHQINGSIVYRKAGKLRGAHAIGISKATTIELLELSKKSNIGHMDMLLENLSERYPANIVRYDLESYISGHKGVIFQDRRRFPSIISQSIKRL